MKDESKQKEFDEQVRRMFADAEVQPSPQVWDRVEAALDNKPRRRPAFWWWWGVSALLLIAVGGTWLLMNHEPAPSPLATHQAKSPAPSSSDSKTNKVNPGTTSNSSSSEGEKQIAHAEIETQTTQPGPDPAANKTGQEETPSTEKTGNTKNEVKTAIPSSTKSDKQVSVSKAITPTEINRAEKATAANSESKKDPGQSVTIASSPGTKAPEKKTAEQKQSADKPATAENKSSALAQAPSKTEASQAAPQDKTQNPVKPQSDPAKSQDVKNNIPENKTPDQPDAQVVTSSSMTIKKQEDKTQKDQTDKPSSPGNANPTSPAKKDSVIAIQHGDSVNDKAAEKNPASPVVKTDTLGKAFPLISICGYFSPEVYNRVLSSNTSAFNIGSEKQNPKYSTGIKLGIALRDKLEVSIGCAYSQVNQEFAPNTVVFPRYLNGPFTFNSSFGDMSVPAATMLTGFSPNAPSWITQFNCKYQYTQTIQYLNIPLEGRLHFGKKHLDLYVAAGMNFQYTLVEQATLELLKESVINRIDYSNLGVPKLNYAVQLGFGIGYKLNKHLGFYLEPNGRYNLLPQTNTSAVKSGGYFLGGAGGLKYTF